jgi:hypothetical protein
LVAVGVGTAVVVVVAASYVGSVGRSVTCRGEAAVTADGRGAGVVV